jgi:hypothetical protein
MSFPLSQRERGKSKRSESGSNECFQVHLQERSDLVDDFQPGRLGHRRVGPLVGLPGAPALRCVP